MIVGQIGAGVSVEELLADYPYSSNTPGWA